MKVSNIIGHNGNAVKNQFVIENDDNILTFQSYSTIICTYDKNNYTLTFKGDGWGYSCTTSKYLNIFLLDYCYIPEYVITEVKGFIRNGGIIKKEKINSYTIIKDF